MWCRAPRGNGASGPWPSLERSEEVFKEILAVKVLWKKYSITQEHTMVEEMLKETISKGNDVEDVEVEDLL